MATLEEYFAEKKLAFNATFGEAILFYRKEQKLTQAALGEKMGMQGAQIGDYENGKISRPRFATVRKFEEALGASLNQYYVLSTFSIDLDIVCDKPGVLPDDFINLVAERENLTFSQLHIPDASCDCFLFTSTEKQDLEDVIALLKTDSEQEEFLKECVMAPKA